MHRLQFYGFNSWQGYSYLSLDFHLLADLYCTEIVNEIKCNHVLESKKKATKLNNQKAMTVNILSWLLSFFYFHQMDDLKLIAFSTSSVMIAVHLKENNRSISLFAFTVNGLTFIPCTSDCCTILSCATR